MPGTIFGVSYSPEGATNYTDGRDIVSQATWSSPVTNKLLLEAGYATYASHWGWMPHPGAITNLVQMTTFTPTFRVYRGIDNIFDNSQNPNTWRASATYVTGAHNMKVGYQGAYHIEETTDFANDARYTLTDLGVFGPGLYSATIRIAPWQKSNRTEYHAVYAQDQWTIGRVTLQGALRFDRAWSWFPAAHNGAPETSVWNAQPTAFPKSKGVTGYTDITPRLGVAYDLFGRGKTSLKLNVGEYLQSASDQENYTVSNPALDNRNGRRPPNFQTAASRTFLDLNGNHVPDCDMLQQEPNGECLTRLGNFANPLTLTVVNPDVLHGWGVRPRDWQVVPKNQSRSFLIGPPIAKLTSHSLIKAAGSEMPNALSSLSRLFACAHVPAPDPNADPWNALPPVAGTTLRIGPPTSASPSAPEIEIWISRAFAVSMALLVALPFMAVPTPRPANCTRPSLAGPPCTVKKKFVLVSNAGFAPAPCNAGIAARIAP